MYRTDKSNLPKFRNNAIGILLNILILLNFVKHSHATGYRAREKL